MSFATLAGTSRSFPLIVTAAEARTWRDAAFVFIALFMMTLSAYVLDERLLNGISVWIKPLKFQASLALHFATLAALAQLLPEVRRRARSFRAVVAVSTAAGFFEIVYIMLQSARGRASHFNDQTVLEVVMYALMGIGAVLLVAAPFILGVWLLRDYGRRRLLEDPLRLAAALGMILSAVTTLVVAGYLSTHGSHWVGNVASDAGGLPVFGWSRQAGDLRVAHFFSTHAMQILPLAGLAVRDAGVRGGRWILAAGAAYLLFTAAVFVQALLGQPFLTLGAY